MILTSDQQRLFVAQMGRTGSTSFALAAADCTYRDAVYTRDRRPEFEIAWRRAERLARQTFRIA